MPPMGPPPQGMPPMGDPSGGQQLPPELMAMLQMLMQQQQAGPPEGAEGAMMAQGGMPPQGDGGICPHCGQPC